VHGNFSPESLGGATVPMLLVVDDLDSVVERAVAAGATEAHPVTEEHRWAPGTDQGPFGHHWQI
jgi:PhnB protein